MLDKRLTRMRRSQRARNKIRTLGAHRLCVHRTPRHIYAQLIAPGGATVLACASSLEGEVKQGLANTGNVQAAIRVIPFDFARSAISFPTRIAACTLPVLASPCLTSPSSEEAHASTVAPPGAISCA